VSGKRNILRDLGETLNSAKALGQGEVLDVLEEPLGVAEVALDPEADHPAKSRLLPLGKLVLRVGRETRVDDLGAEGRGLEEVGHDKGVLLVLLHPDVKGFQASVGEEAVKGTGNGANGYFTIMKACELCVFVPLFEQRKERKNTNSSGGT